MSALKLLLYILLGVVAFMVVSAVISAVLAVLSFVWALATLITTLALFGALGYGVYRLVMLVSGNSRSQSDSSFGFDTRSPTKSQESVGIEPESRVERIKRKYANGELSESEMERLLEREMDTSEYDSIDRELQRERT